MKDYKTLSNSLKELFYLLSHRTNREGFKVTDIQSTEMVIDLLDKEIETLSKISANYLSYNKIVEYHDSIVSYGKIEMVKDKMKMLIEDFYRELKQNQQIDKLIEARNNEQTLKKENV